MMSVFKVIVLFAHFCVLCSGIEATPPATPSYDQIETKHESPKCQGIGYDYAYETGRCYKFHSEFLSWIEAREICRNEDGDLAIMNSEAEARVVVTLFKKYPAESIITSFEVVKNSALLGFYYSDSAKIFKTIEGQTLEQAGYTKNIKDSNNVLSYPFGTIDREGLLTSCNHGAFMFICEKGPLDIVD